MANVVPELLSSIIIRVQQARGDDMWVWLENPTGNYTVAQFAWRLLKNRLTAKDNLKNTYALFADKWR